MLGECDLSLHKRRRSRRITRGPRSSVPSSSTTLSSSSSQSSILLAAEETFVRSGCVHGIPYDRLSTSFTRERERKRYRHVCIVVSFSRISFCRTLLYYFEKLNAFNVRQLRFFSISISRILSPFFLLLGYHVSTIVCTNPPLEPLTTRYDTRRHDTTRYYTTLHYATVNDTHDDFLIPS